MDAVPHLQYRRRAPDRGLELDVPEHHHVVVQEGQAAQWLATGPQGVGLAGRQQGHTGGAHRAEQGAGVGGKAGGLLCRKHHLGETVDNHPVERSAGDLVADERRDHIDVQRRLRDVKNRQLPGAQRGFQVRPKPCRLANQLPGLLLEGDVETALAVP